MVMNPNVDMTSDTKEMIIGSESSDESSDARSKGKKKAANNPANDKNTRNPNRPRHRFTWSVDPRLAASFTFFSRRRFALASRRAAFLFFRSYFSNEMYGISTAAPLASGRSAPYTQAMTAEVGWIEIGSLGPPFDDPADWRRQKYDR